VELRWLDPDRADRRDVDGWMAVRVAAHAVDTPDLPQPTRRAAAAWLRHGWDGDRPEIGLTRDASGRVIGALQVYLPRWDNTHLGSVKVTVDPQVRRRGLGRRLFEVGVERVRAERRRTLLASCVAQTAGEAFLKAIGLDQVYEEIYRRQDLVTLDWPRLDREYARALSHAEGYELVRVPGAVPAELLDGVVAMTEAINDAPTEEMDFEDEVFSPERIRSFETAVEARGDRLYRLVARERATSTLAGHTMVEVDGDMPWDANQLDTSVLRAHRGHRLGILLKIGMLHWLREEEPQLRTVLTGNAASNSHMIGVNELLGYHVVAKELEWQRSL
jgi:GNAT superfamily N-acetyltransferase